MPMVPLRDLAHAAYRKAPPTTTFVMVLRHATDERDPIFLSLRAPEPPSPNVVDELLTNHPGFGLARLLDMSRSFDEQWPAEPGNTSAPASSAPAHPMQALLDHLIAKHTPKQGADGKPIDEALQVPAFIGQVQLFASPPIMGSISRAPNLHGVYRILYPAIAKDERGGEHSMLIESFFVPQAVTAISVQRTDLIDEVKKQGVALPTVGPKLWTPRS